MWLKISAKTNEIILYFYLSLFGKSGEKVHFKFIAFIEKGIKKKYIYT